MLVNKIWYDMVFSTFNQVEVDLGERCAGVNPLFRFVPQSKMSPKVSQIHATWRPVPPSRKF